MIGHFTNHVGVRSEHHVCREKKNQNFFFFFLINVPRVDQVKTSSQITILIRDWTQSHTSTQVTMKTIKWTNYIHSLLPYIRMCKKNSQSFLCTIKCTRCWGHNNEYGAAPPLMVLLVQGSVHFFSIKRVIINIFQAFQVIEFLSQLLSCAIIV